MTEDNGLGDPDNRGWFLAMLEAGPPRSRLISWEASLPGLWVATFSVFFRVFPLYLLGAKPFF